MSNNLCLLKFKEINLKDKFFDSLKNDYKEFEVWFNRKANEKAYVQLNDNKNIDGFLYLKIEKGSVKDIEPPLYEKNILKIGTFKINPHGTRLGERFIKKAMDFAIQNNVSICYVTLFKKHEALLDLFKMYGFEYYGIKKNGIKQEVVLTKELKSIKMDVIKDFPLINCKNTNKYLLAVYPQYHSVMFPDSILNTEKINILSDITITNSIHKTYVTKMREVPNLRMGDLIIIYRTKDFDKSAEYSAVATSVCVVDDINKQENFAGFKEFYEYVSKYSIFDRSDLNYWYNKGGCFAINMTYNAAFSKRITRHDLIQKVGLNREEYWGLMQLSDRQFYDIINLGGVKENQIINA